MRRVGLFLLFCGLAGCGGGSDTSPGPGPGVSPSRAATEVPRFGDADPHDWSDTKPWQYPIHGIDVSKYQGDIDWATARNSGVSFAFIKATEGGDVADPMFARNWEAARLAGVPRGAYHYYYFCRTAQEQAKWFIQNVPVDRSALPPVLDMEWTHKSRTCTHRPEPETVRGQLRLTAAMLAQHYGKRPIIYTTVDFYQENELWKIDTYPFWLRSVANHPSAIYEGQPWTFWQYTGTGLVNGIDGQTDLNAFAGTQSQWWNWVASNTR